MIYCGDKVIEFVTEQRLIPSWRLKIIFNDPKVRPEACVYYGVWPVWAETVEALVRQKANHALFRADVISDKPSMMSREQAEQLHGFIKGHMRLATDHRMILQQVTTIERRV